LRVKGDIDGGCSSGEGSAVLGTSSHESSVGCQSVRTEDSTVVELITIIGLTVGRCPQGVLCLSIYDEVGDGKGQAEGVGIIFEGRLGKVPLLSQRSQVSLLLLLLLGRGDGCDRDEDGSSILHVFDVILGLIN